MIRFSCKGYFFTADDNAACRQVYADDSAACRQVYPDRVKSVMRMPAR
ncbi:hypothetical protein H6F73_20130 [Microcoleus sp. FACHB-68]|nr:hypothetical protein [Microcoleus sp. FACHB-68]